MKCWCLLLHYKLSIFPLKVFPKFLSCHPLLKQHSSQGCYSRNRIIDSDASLTLVFQHVDCLMIVKRDQGLKIFWCLTCANQCDNQMLFTGCLFFISRKSSSFVMIFCMVENCYCYWHLSTSGYLTSIKRNQKITWIKIYVFILPLKGHLCF